MPSTRPTGIRQRYSHWLPKTRHDPCRLRCGVFLLRSAAQTMACSREAEQVIDFLWSDVIGSAANGLRDRGGQSKPLSCDIADRARLATKKTNFWRLAHHPHTGRPSTVAPSSFFFVVPGLISSLPSVANMEKPVDAGSAAATTSTTAFATEAQSGGGGHNPRNGPDRSQSHGHGSVHASVSSPPASSTAAVAGGTQAAATVEKGKDVALTVVGERAREYDPQVEARVLRKIDWFLMPTMILGKPFPQFTILVRSQCCSFLGCGGVGSASVTNFDFCTRACRSYCLILLADDVVSPPPYTAR